MLSLLRRLVLFIPGWLRTAVVFVAAAVLFLCLSGGLATLIELQSARVTRRAMFDAGVTWASARGDGTTVILTGTAPDEAARFRLLNLIGSLVDAGMIRDRTTVEPPKGVEAPRFSVEMLRNDDGIQLIGLLPSDDEEKTLLTAASSLTPGIDVQDMIETASYAAPPAWPAVFDYGVAALGMLERAKISIAADGIKINAIAATESERRSLEARLKASAPQGVPVVIEVSAPRPVLTPFTLRFVKDAGGARFDACSADTGAARDLIVQAAKAAGVAGDPACIIGLGVPTPTWAAATTAGIRAVDALGHATITFSDADVTLLAAEDVPQATFDRAVGQLQADLPDVFSLDAKLEKKARADEGPAEFSAELTNDGKVTLRGRLADDMQGHAVDAFAKAQFGSRNVTSAMRTDAVVPEGWPTRVLAGLAALAQVHDGSLSVQPDRVAVTGRSGDRGAPGRISQILSQRLGQGQTFAVDVRYDKELDPQAAMPSPQDCVAQVNALLSKDKITFDPGSPAIAGSALGLVGKIADVLRACPPLKLEVAGHTDAQGSEDGNKALSQARAEAVVAALAARKVDVSGMRARGYGEADPVGDNDTDAGREANRRIEFALLGDAPKPAEGAATPDATAAFVPYQPARETVPCLAELQDLLSRKAITFQPGTAQIDPDSTATLTTATMILGTCPGTPVEIAAFADPTGADPAAALTLTQAQAEAVRAALQERALDVGQIAAKGYGATAPVADPATPEGRAANARVEFHGIGPAAAAPDGGGDAAVGACLDDVKTLLDKEKIQFEPGSATIAPKADALIAKIADALKTCPGLPVEVGGYTDAQGSDDGNLKLSQARADAVLAALKSKGLDTAALTAKGYGKADPIADNATDAGREANRRIEFNFAAGPDDGVADDLGGDGSGDGSGADAGADAGAPADPKSCVDAANAMLKKQKITFEPGAASITANAETLVAALGDVLQPCPGAPIEIAGYTDAQGSDDGNLKLSQARADAVLAALKAGGVDTSAMTAKGYGEANPIADNATDDGREANRRLEFHLTTAAPGSN